LWWACPEKERETHSRSWGTEKKKTGGRGSSAERRKRGTEGFSREGVRDLGQKRNKRPQGWRESEEEKKNR